jgi:hypothetical protein
MSAEQGLRHPFKLREMICQDADGRQVLVRVDDDEKLVLARLLTREGADFPVKDGEKISIAISVRIKNEKTDGPRAEYAVNATYCLCGPIMVNGKPYYWPC